MDLNAICKSQKVFPRREYSDSDLAHILKGGTKVKNFLRLSNL